MIRLYRILKSPSETFFTFQGSAEDTRAIQDMLKFTRPPLYPRTSTLRDNFEGGYYLYAKGDHRSEIESCLTQYFDSNFTPPDTKLLMFESDFVYEDEGEIGGISSAIEKEIALSFGTLGYRVKPSGLRFCVFRKDAVHLVDGLEAYEGITYKVIRRLKGNALLQVDIAHLFVVNGEEVASTERIPALFPEQESDVALALHQFTTQSSQAVLELCQRFVKSMPPLRTMNQMQFPSEPTAPENVGFETWFLPHETDLEFIVGKGLKVSLPCYLEKEAAGIYAFPNRPVIVIIIYPGPDFPDCPILDWQPIIKEIKSKTSSLLSRRTKFGSFAYSPGQSVEEILQRCKAGLAQVKDHQPLVILITPPKSTGPQKPPTPIDAFTRQIHKDLRYVTQGTYIQTIMWDTLFDTHDRKYVIENALLKGICAFGATPWKLVEMPREPNLTNDFCFIGLDVNRFNDSVGGVILSRSGLIFGYHLIRLPKPASDKVQPESCYYLVQKLLEHYQRETSYLPKHLIIHLDGNVDWQPADIKDRFSEFSCDIVEIRKHGGPRLFQAENRDGTPSKGIAIGSEDKKVAYMVNSKAKLTKMESDRWIFPAPDTLTIKKIMGPSSMRILAAQVYALTHVSYTSYRNTIQIPATIEYADAVVNHIRLKGEETGGSIRPDTLLHWI